jgi:hypothetical protein
MDNETYCPQCRTEMHQVDDFYWCTECAEFWYIEQVERGRIPGDVHWQIRNSERDKLTHWNARIEAWNKREMRDNSQG